MSQKSKYGEKISILGYGKMAKALACGLDKEFELEICGRDNEKITQFIKQNGLKNATKCVVERDFSVDNKILILAIKPYALESFTYKGSANITFSVMAGVSIEKISGVLDSKHYCRAMPNVASLIGAGISAIYTNSSEARILGEKIFGRVGEVVFLDKESLINPASAISGSGPAYLGLFAEALIDAGIREGLSIEVATKLTSGLFSGFGELLEHQNATEIRLDTTSPNGTTTEALQVLEESGVRGIIRKAVHNANIKANSLS